MSKKRGQINDILADIYFLRKEDKNIIFYTEYIAEHVDMLSKIVFNIEKRKYKKVKKLIKKFKNKNFGYNTKLYERKIN